MASAQQLHDDRINELMRGLNTETEQPTAGHTYKAMDAAFAAEEDAVLTQADDVEVRFESTLEDVLRDKNKADSVFRTSRNRDRARLFEEVVNNMELDSESKTNLIKHAQATSASILNNPEASKAAGAAIELQDVVAKMPSPDSVSQIQWNEELDKIIDTRLVFHSPDFDRARVREGFFDQYVGDSLIPFELLAAFGKDIYSKEVGEDDRWSDLSTAWETYTMWQSYIQDKAQEHPDDYAAGAGLGFNSIFIFDPAFVLGIAKPIGLGVRGIKAGASFIRTTRHLKDAIGEANLARVVSSSHEGLVEFFQKAEPEFLTKVERGLTPGNPLSDRVEKALIKARGKDIVEAEIASAKSPMALATQQAQVLGDVEGLANIKRMVMIAAHPDGESIRAAFEVGELAPMILLKQDMPLPYMHPTTAHGVKVNNLAAMDDIAESIRYDALQNRQSLVEGVHATTVKRSVDDLIELDFGVNASLWGSNFRNIVARGLLPKDAVFKGRVQKELVDDFTVTEQFTRAINRGYNHMNEAVWKGLGSKGTKDLNDMAFAANEAGTWGRIRGGVFEVTNEAGEVIFQRATTPDVLDAYVARKRMINLMAADIERSLHIQANKRGIKLFKGQHMSSQYSNPAAGVDGFDIYGKPMKWSSKLQDEGWTAHRYDGQEGTNLVFLNETEASQFITDIPANYRMMPEGGVDGYMRIEYPDKYIVSELTYATDDVMEGIVDATGQIERAAITPKVGEISKQISAGKEKLSGITGEMDRAKRRIQSLRETAFKNADEIYEHHLLEIKVKDLAKEYNDLAKEVGQLQSQIRPQVTTVALDQAAKGLEGLPRPTLRRIATAGTRQDADKAIAKAQAEGRVLFASRTQPGQVDASYSGSFMEDFIRMTEDQLGYLENTMHKHGYGAEAIHALRTLHTQYAQMPAAFKPASALKARGERLKHIDASGNLTEPNIRVAKEADAIYTQWASGYVGKGAWLDDATNSFLEAYGHNLSRPGDWLSSVKKDASVSDAIKTEIGVYQNHLKQMHNRSSSWMTWLDNKQQAIADNALAAGRPMAKLADEWLVPSQMASGASALTTRSLLGGFSMVQLLLQPSFGILAGSSAHMGRTVAGLGVDSVQFAKAYGKTINEFVEAVLPIMFNKDGLTLTPVGRDGMEFLRRSGSIDGIDWDAMRLFVSDIRKDRGALAKGGNRIINGSSYFFTNGEKINQAFGTLLAKNALEAEIRSAAKKGMSFKGLTLKDLDDGGSARFVAKSIIDGKTFSLNMQRHNAPNFSRDEALSLVMKFKEFMSHSTALYFDPLLAKKLTKGQFWGLWGGTMTVLGPVGIPLVWDLQVAAELAHNQFDNMRDLPPSAHGRYTYDGYVWAAQKMGELTGGAISDTAWFTWMTQGLQSSLTEQQWGLGQRMMIGAIFAEYAEGGATDDLILGAVYSTMKKYFNSGGNTLDEMVMAIRTGDYEAGFERMFFEATQPIPGVSGLARAGKSISEGMEDVLTPSGKLMIKHPSVMDVLQVAMAQTPASEAASHEYRSLMMRRQEALSEWTRDRVNELIQTYNINPQYGSIQLGIILNDLSRHMPELVPTFQQAAVLAFKKEAMDLQTQTYIDLLTKQMVDQKTMVIMGLKPQNQRNKPKGRW